MFGDVRVPKRSARQRSRTARSSQHGWVRAPAKGPVERREHRARRICERSTVAVASDPGSSANDLTSGDMIERMFGETTTGRVATKAMPVGWCSGLLALAEGVGHGLARSPRQKADSWSVQISASCNTSRTSTTYLRYCDSGSCAMRWQRRSNISQWQWKMYRTSGRASACPEGSGCTSMPTCTSMLGTP